MCTFTLHKAATNATQLQKRAGPEIFFQSKQTFTHSKKKKKFGKFCARLYAIMDDGI